MDFIIHFFSGNNEFWFIVLAPFYFDYETFTGPFLTFLAFGQYLIPLGVLELYFISKENSNNEWKFAMALTLIIITIFIAIGIIAATMGMWLPML
jgi:hypothetical protein